MTTGNLQVAIYGFTSPIRTYEPAGICYETRIIRDKITLGHCTLPIYKNSPMPQPISQEQRKKSSEEPAELRKELFDADNEKYEKYLMKLDPNDCKNQDHYKVLGLSKLRWQATSEEIRFCYRAKVLKHHPDKKKHRGIVMETEEYFTCITKAYEQIGMSDAKRQAFDSVDHKFNDTIPNEKSINPDNFYNELAPIFQLNSRWSSLKPVPELGKADASRQDVENFYDFWFNFQSWREFSYLDEEDKERGEDRYERREMEKQNKAERERRRKEEAKRIRKLVDMAYAKDPRIIKFKKEQQAKKDKVKEDRQRAIREKQEAIEREKREKEEADAKQKEEADRKAKEEREREKKERDIAKKAMSQQRKRLKKLAEEAGHWTENPRDKLTEMERIERICIGFTVDQLRELCEKVETLSLHLDIQKALTDAERLKKESAGAKVTLPEDKNKENEKQVEKETWTSEEIQLLVKASNTFPPGTVERWVQIADYINEHRKDSKGLPPKTEKQVIKQCKAVQTMNVKLPATTQNQLGTALPDEDVWSAAEQKTLEDAIKKYPASDAERWEKISTDVGTKSKKACIRRFKYLVQMVKNKK
ncbi:hypothetical protein GCK72_013725 [Caenorhabditis remanei]|uniref:DnaJ homolog subfamily C member 2 n=1 Tax=Caenorhabditis remanei TaxID=31234 RepID=A0A6A5GPH5_CAERE|nr:hypothetical protein GCK72_013725 [Caenorhabditis remanei]KAF1757270.1 hypothetical protein GCK72_013725 [Caenorhabditis remanei]